MSTLEESAKSFWEARGVESHKSPTRAVTLAPVSEEEALFLDTLERNQLLPMMKLRPGMRVLDVGCGTGRWTRRFASHGATVVACDVSPGLLDTLRKSLQEEGTLSHTTLLRVDLSTGKLPEEVGADFDLIFVGGVLQYIEDEAVLSLLQQLRERLAPTGKLMLREGIRRERAREEQGVFEGTPYSVLYRDRSDFPRFFAQSKLRLIEQKNLAGFPTVDLVEKLLSRFQIASYGSAEQLELSPDGAVWAKFITAVTPFFAFIWPRADRGAVVLHKLLGERDFWGSHQVFLLEPSL
jgi:SAM-dependent methyltransferase